MDADEIADRVTGLVEVVDEHTSRLTLAGDSLRTIAAVRGILGTDFDVIEPPELRPHLADVARRLRRASAGGRPGRWG